MHCPDQGMIGLRCKVTKEMQQDIFNLTAGTGNQLTIKKKHRVPISMLFHRPAPFQVPTSTGLIFLNRCFLHWINNREVLAHSLKDCLAELYRNKAALPFGGFPPQSSCKVYNKLPVSFTRPLNGAGLV